MIMIGTYSSRKTTTFISAGKKRTSATTSAKFCRPPAGFMMLGPIEVMVAWMIGQTPKRSNRIR